MNAPDEQAARIAAGLTKAPKAVLVSCPDGAQEWLAILRAMPDGGYRQSHRRSILPLIERGLLEMVRDISFDGENWVSRLYTLTPLGLRVRAIIAEQATDLPT